MNLIELFCGTGGFSRGAHSAGFRVAAAYDLDPILSSSYRINFPATNLHRRDIAKLTGDNIRADVGDGEVFGIFGGPPCQGFSDIGRRDIADPRRELLGHYFRIVREVRPSFFVMENVRGLAYADSAPLLTAALETIRPTYDVAEPRIWNAADFGAATNRHRMFVIGVRKDLKAPFDNERLRKFCRPAVTVRQAISDLEDAVQLSSSDEFPEFDRWKIVRQGPGTAYARQLRTADRTFTGHMRTAHTPRVIERFAKVQPGSMDIVGRHPRLTWSGQCPTLRAGTGADKGSYQSVRPIHPSCHRVITVREAARLQGFPDAHIFHPTVWHSFRMIGNSVSPFMASAIFQALRDHFNIQLPLSGATGTASRVGASPEAIAAE